MFKILVCFKIIDDTDELLAEDWLNLGTGCPDVSYVRRMPGCFDEAAIENALRIKDRCRELGDDATITAVTIDPGYSEHVLNNFSAIGIDRIVCVDCACDLRFSPETTASVLACFIRENSPFDIILAGALTSPGGSGMVPLMLAEKIHLPCVTECIDFDITRQGIAIENITDIGICSRVVHSPIVCTVGNAAHSYLRIPTLREKLHAPTVLPERVCIEKAARTDVLLDLRRDAGERSCIFAKGANAYEKAAFVCRCIRAGTE
jgi:electron transfer flavoprotein alpha/beta subunit